MIHHDNELLKNAVINNLVPEGKREILFSTQISDESDGEKEESEDFCAGRVERIEARIGELERIVKKLVEYLVKESSHETSV